ncbi:MAG: protein kinase [Myxococcota bacterium]
MTPQDPGTKPPPASPPQANRRLCGPFELVGPLARGGMGEVWKARHGETPAVIKLVTLGSPDARRWFAEEVRAHARLQHPHILQVLDLGTLDADLPDGPKAGTPWMALEYASAGDLRTMVKRGLDWSATRILLLAVLDALAHAHANGVVHRDLKPANVLIAGPNDLRPGLKLADFGIAHVVGSSEPEGVIAGSPMTIAPEQVAGEVRAQGPWTDLYALGCMAYRMVCGRYPFTGKGALSQHLLSPFPAVEPRIAVPVGLPEWILRMTAKEPADRFQCAADAAHALWGLPHSEGPADSLPGALASSRTLALTALRTAWGAPEPTPTASIAPPAREWRRPASPPTPPLLVDAGLTLFALRRWETVGREAERDALWRVLLDVRATRRPAVVLLRGPRGIGLSHLGRWLCTRAHALGAAEAFATHASTEDRPDGALLRSMRAILRADGLSGEELREAIEASNAFWGVASPELDGILQQLLEGTSTETVVRRGAMRRLLFDRATRRAAVWWMDDAHRSPDALRLAWSTVRNATDAPLLMVLGVGEAESDALDALEACERVHTVRLGPLSLRESNQLGIRSLRLTGGLVSQVSKDSRGLPSLLQRRLEQLLDDRLLTSTPGGYALAAGATWKPLGHGDGLDVQGLLDSLDPLALRLVHAAAVWGDEVEHDAWVASVAPDGAGPGEIPLQHAMAAVRVAERLIRRGWMEATPSGWRFTSRAFVDALMAHLPEGALHTARRGVARALASQERVDPVRLARLHEQLGEPALALERILATLLGDDSTFDRHSLGSASLSALATRYADAVGLPADHPTREILAAWDLHGVFDQEEARLRAAAALETARRHGWTLVEGIAEAALAGSSGPDAFDGHIRAAISALGRSEPTFTRAFAYDELTAMLLSRGRLDEALQTLETLHESAIAYASPRLMALWRARVAAVRRAKGEHEPMQDLLDSANELIRTGYNFAAASLLLLAGDSARLEGDLDASDVLNLRASALYDATGLEEPAVYFNLAFNALRRGDAVKARSHLDEGRRIHAQPWWDRVFAVFDLGWASLVGDPGILAERWAHLSGVYAAAPEVLDQDEVDVLLEAADRIAARDPGLADAMRALASGS